MSCATRGRIASYGTHRPVSLPTICGFVPNSFSQRYSSTSTIPVTPFPSSPESASSMSSSSFLSNSPSTDEISNAVSDKIHVTVKAFFVARSIDIVRLSSIFEAQKKEFQNKSVTITLEADKNRYLTIFKYGSVVFFNIPEAEQEDYLRKMKASIVSPIAEGLQHTEDYKLIIHKNLEKPSIIKATHTNIKSLDSRNLTIVGTIIAQTVALDYYAVLADRILEQFASENKKIEESGDFKTLDSHGLFKLMASNNSVITNVLSKLGIFEGTDAAWDNADYYYTWEALRKDFELDSRFEDLNLKLDIVKDNTKFFVEVLQSKKSDQQEKVIIYLISAEIILSLIHLYISVHGG